MIDFETWKKIWKSVTTDGNTVTIDATEFVSIADELARKQKRIDAMQRKIDRYKRYTLIKKNKEKAFEKEYKSMFDRVNTAVPFTASFSKTWRV